MLSIRYEHKKWVPRDGKAKSPPRVSEEKNSVYRARPETSSQHGHVKETERFFEKQKGAHPPSASNRAPQQVNVVLFVFPLKSMDNWCISCCLLFWYVLVPFFFRISVYASKLMILMDRSVMIQNNTNLSKNQNQKQPWKLNLQQVNHLVLLRFPYQLKWIMLLICSICSLWKNLEEMTMWHLPIRIHWLVSMVCLFYLISLEQLLLHHIAFPPRTKKIQVNNIL